MESAGQSVAFQYGILGVVALAFAYVIVALWRHGIARDKVIETERIAWAAERATLRAEYETKHVGALVEYAKQLQELRGAGQEREDMIRKEYSDLMERVAEEASKSATATTDVLHKVYDRFLCPRTR